MFSKKEMYEMVCDINSPFDNLTNQFKADKCFEDIFVDNADLENYDLSMMIPKVTYDDWIVCLYKEDEKLYYITEEDVTEVEPVAILMYNEDFEVLNADGEAMEEDEIFEYCDNLCCGESDDMRFYVYFEEVM